MKKNIIVILIISVIIIMIEAKFIAKEQKEIVVNMQEIATELINAQIFEDDLSQIDRENIIKKYNFNNEKIKDIVSFVGTGATSEEILIIELLDLKDINETKEIIQSKIEERKIDFQNYLPNEVYKLENYNLESKGKYIVLCISNNYNKTSEIINKYIY